MKRLHLKADPAAIFSDYDFTDEAIEAAGHEPIVELTAMPQATAEAEADTPADVPAVQGDSAAINPAAVPTEAPKKEKEAVDPAIEAEFAAFHQTLSGVCSAEGLGGILRMCGKSRLAVTTCGTTDWHKYIVRDNRLFYDQERYTRWRPFGEMFTNALPTDRYAYHSRGELVVKIGYVASDATTRVLTVRCKAESRDGRHGDELETGEVTVDPLCKAKAITAYDPCIFFPQPQAQLRAILGDVRPWVLPWLSQNEYVIEEYFSAPWLETLQKAGYAFAHVFLRGCAGINTAPSTLEQFNRLCGPGTKPKTIFKAQKCVYETLKREPDLGTWDVYRRMAKTGKLTKDTLVQAYDRHLTNRDLERVSSILGARYGGRPVFSWQSLMGYLGRLDLYEAIPSGLALEILSDYLGMCRELDMAPRIDGDSLKREHDIAARLCRQKRNEEEARKMAEAKAAFERNKAFLAYREDVYFIRPIFDYDELIDEATQQHNCVASYGSRIAEGKTFVLTMRETAHPGKSLVTVELSPDCSTIRQKYLASNQPIRSKSISDFLDRWHRHVKNEAARRRTDTQECEEETVAAA